MVIYSRSLKGVCRGSVLIYALGMTALVSTLSTAMILSLQSDMRWVNKQNVLIEQRSNLMAIETKTMTLLNSQQEKSEPKNRLRSQLTVPQSRETFYSYQMKNRHGIRRFR